MKSFVSPLNSIWMMGLVAWSTICAQERRSQHRGKDGDAKAEERTLNGQCFMSDWTSASANLRPMRRLASKTVLGGARERQRPNRRGRSSVMKESSLVGVHGDLVLGGIANKTLIVAAGGGRASVSCWWSTPREGEGRNPASAQDSREGNVGGGGAVSLVVGNDLHAVVLPHSDTRVGAAGSG